MLLFADRNVVLSWADDLRFSETQRMQSLGFCSFTSLLPYAILPISALRIPLAANPTD